MFHTDATRVRHFRLYHHTTRSLLTTAITAGTLLAFLMTFVVHLTLAWSNGQAAALVLGQPNFTTATRGYLCDHDESTYGRSDRSVEWQGICGRI